MRAGSLFTSLAATLALAGCQQPAQPTPTKSDAAQQATPDAKAAPPSKPEPPSSPGEPAASTSDAKGSPPPWFTPDIIEHEQIIKQSETEQKLAGVYASAMVMQLKADTTFEGCMSAIKAKIGETVSDLPDATPGPNGRLTLHGDAGPYQYTIVCGPGKDGKPTVYLSYSLE